MQHARAQPFGHTPSPTLATGSGQPMVCGTSTCLRRFAAGSVCVAVGDVGVIAVDNTNASGWESTT